ncbi:hypothetical protein T492DRAFT_842517 [Pavlovales sp. CCMP2436]|nr:hypothetical protein T492DRAFT_842517 [Pavlovales sp. CCMP2436]
MPVSKFLFATCVATLLWMRGLDGSCVRANHLRHRRKQTLACRNRFGGGGGGRGAEYGRSTFAKGSDEFYARGVCKSSERAVDSIKKKEKEEKKIGGTNFILDDSMGTKKS